MRAAYNVIEFAGIATEKMGKWMMIYKELIIPNTILRTPDMKMLRANPATVVTFIDSPTAAVVSSRTFIAVVFSAC